MKTIHEDANKIIAKTIAENLPDKAVENALNDHKFNGKIYLLAIGKAAWVMAKAASDFLGDKIKKGIVITKYEHSKGIIPNIEIIEAGHPLSDENSILGTNKSLEMAKELNENDEILFLVSGGGSALFESPLDGITLADIVTLNKQLLASGANIVEMNIIRKRLSRVKAGRFAQSVNGAKIFTIVLSDVVGNHLASIASGPATPDDSTVVDALEIVDRYNLQLPDVMLEYLKIETPKILTNIETVITGSVQTLCESTAKTAHELGYTPIILSNSLECEASEAGKLIASMVNTLDKNEFSLKRPCAIIWGGETVVHLKGTGLGGRNQEMALAAATVLNGTEDTVFFSLGSDGTDGPTDAAGGIVDGTTLQKMYEKGLDVKMLLSNNDSYNALKAVNALIMTGPTGTNVNDVSVLLCK